jgi:integrase/recombinase XerD
MTPLRRRMVEELKIRQFSSTTCRDYVRRIERLAQFYGRSPDVLTQEEVRAFLLHLVTEPKVSHGVLRGYVSALRFFYKITLRRDWSIPFPRAEHHIPTVLSRDEVLRSLEAVRNIKHRTALTTCYAAGLRVSETVSLKVTDLNSERMVIFVRQGKRHKDRLVPLSTSLLDLLRAYWKIMRPTDWLFPGRAGEHLSVRVVQHACGWARRRAGIERGFTVHSLRHSFASHIARCWREHSHHPGTARPRQHWNNRDLHEARPDDTDEGTNFGRFRRCSLQPPSDLRASR